MSAVPAVTLSASQRLKRRSWYDAALLSFVCPGLGQLYNGRLRRALITFGAAELLIITALVTSHRIGEAVFVAALFISLAGVVALQVLATIDAAILALRQPMIERRRFHRRWIYIAALFIAAAGNQVLISRNGIGNWNIPAGSMIPTLEVGDHLIAEKRYYLSHAPERGEIALFKLPTNQRIDYIQRVVGLPGETIQMIGGRLHINGEAVQRQRISDETETRGAATIRIVQYLETLPSGRNYRIREERGDDGMMDNTPPYLVPAGHYFVLGDNRDNSQDSRVLTEVGFVPRANFRDRAAFIYWSRDRARIGRHIE